MVRREVTDEETEDSGVTLSFMSLPGYHEALDDTKNTNVVRLRDLRALRALRASERSDAIAA